MVHMYLSRASGAEKMSHNLLWQTTDFCLKEKQKMPLSLVGISGRQSRLEVSLKAHEQLYLQSNYQVGFCRNLSWT